MKWHHFANLFIEQPSYYIGSYNHCQAKY